MRRVLVTGMGCMTALGNDVPSFWDGLAAGRSGIAGAFAALAPWTASDHFDPRRIQQLDPFTQLALLAAGQAVTQAGFAAASPPKTRIAVVMGSAMAGKSTDDENAPRMWTAVAEGRPATSHPMTIPRYIGNAAASQIGMEFGFQGPTFGLSSSCASSSQAIGMALGLVRAGLVDAALAGGSDIASSLSVQRAWRGLGVLSPDLCRPFSRGRLGTVLGDGAGVVVIESAESAAARGATALAEIAGFGAATEGGAAPDQSMQAAMRAALDDAGLRPDAIDHIDAHGIGTEAGDRAEAAALRALFPDESRRPPLSAIKAMTGHTLGASGVLGLIGTIEAMRHHLAPATLNHQGDDPDCGFDVTPNQARSRSIGAALSNSFGFGGLNAALVLRGIV